MRYATSTDTTGYGFLLMKWLLIGFGCVLFTSLAWMISLLANQTVDS